MAFKQPSVTAEQNVSFSKWNLNAEPFHRTMEMNESVDDRLIYDDVRKGTNPLLVSAVPALQTVIVQSGTASKLHYFVFLNIGNVDHCNFQGEKNRRSIKRCERKTS